MCLIFCVNLKTYFARDISVFSFLNGVELHSRIIYFFFDSVIFKLRSTCFTFKFFLQNKSKIPNQFNE